MAQFAHHHHHGGGESSECSHGHGHDHDHDPGHDSDDESEEDAPDNPEDDGEGGCCASCTPPASDVVESFGLGQFAELVSLSVQTFSAREYLVVEAVYHPPRVVS